MERLWTPWRMRYVSGETRDGSCIFCTKPAMNDDVAQLIIYRSRHSFVIMNLYPYNTGHVMIVPFQHAAELSDVEIAVNHDLWDLIPWVTSALKRVLRCDGFNIGLNLGSVAGAGVSDHVHIHVVPRWEGDANFMPVLGSTMVLPELIPVTYAKIRAEFELMAPRTGEQGTVIPQAGAIPLLVEPGKIALRRAADGTMVLPKGHIEQGEAAFATALREIDEEMGLNGTPAGWAGTLEFEHEGDHRRVAYLLATVEAGPEFENHLGMDTELYSPRDAIDVLSHAPARELLRNALPAIERLLEEAR
jgi:ATP adenylyltransferase